MSGFLGGILDSIGINATPRGMLDAPVGTSTMQRLTNPSPDFSPMISPGLLSNEQRLGAFWNLATRRAKPYTNRDLPQLSEAANEAYDAAAGFVGTSTPVKGIRAYHGSPHKYDRFDMSRIGSGTGLHAYSPGAYFATAENNARGYSRGLSSAENLAGSEIFRRLNRAAIDAGLEPAQARQVADNVISGIMEVGTPKRYLREFDIPAGPYEAPYKRAIEEAQQLGVVARRNMYEVNLNVSPDELLNWNAAANAQSPRVTEALRNAGVNVESAAPYQPRTHEELARLREAGIPGLRYTGEGATEAAPNYVMFRDDIIDILKRYGLLGMIGGGAAAVGAPEQ